MFFRLHKLQVPVFSAALLVSGLFAVTAGCTTTTTVTAPPPAAQADAGPAEETDAGDTAEPVADVCGPVKASKCKPANEGSVIRGIVKFDPTKVKVVSKTKPPMLRVFLHHQVILQDDEEKLGGHPHAFKSYAVDMEKGEARFSLDLCDRGIAMYSEENCGFNIVVMIDDDGGNDPDDGMTALIPRAGKLGKLVPLEVSCHKPSQCLEITADCVDGDACTTFPALKKCETCATDSCPSDDSLCKP